MTCLYCSQTITKPHGNSKYHETCTYELKKRRSRLRYAALAIKNNKYWNSERILRNAYEEADPNKEHEIEELINNGLDIKNYQEEKTVNGSKVYTYIKFGFSYIPPKTIIICKI
jgi:hypothetical protein